MSTTVAPKNADAERGATSANWLFGLSLLGSLPMAIVYCCDLWFRSDYRFFPLLILIPLAMPLFRGRQQQVTGSDSRPSINDIPRNPNLRGPISLGLWFASGLSALCAALLFAPWLALLALTLAWAAWMLACLAQTSWPRLLKWTSPLLVLLLLPLGERSDPLPSFSSSVTYASSNLLDVLGIVHLPAEQTLQLRLGRYDVAQACRGLGNPYLLLALAVLLCMSTRVSLCVGLLVVASAPLWSWGGSVLLVTSGVWLAEKQYALILIEQRLWIAQAIVLLSALISLLLLKWGLQNLLAPFSAHSAGVGGVHKFFNRIVLWPAPDPLRKRKLREQLGTSKSDASSDQRSGLAVRAISALAVAACLFVIAGGVSVLRLTVNRHLNQPNLTELLKHSSAAQTRIEQRLSQDTLPDEFFGMRLIKFDEFALLGTATGIPLTARWIYSNGMQTVELLASAPFRGSLDMERQRLLDGSRVVKPLQSIELRLEETGETQQDDSIVDSNQIQSDHTFRFDELTLADSMIGVSYMAYTNWSIDGSRLESVTQAERSAWQQMLAAIRYQPTTAGLSLWLEGETPDSDAAKENLQQMLGRATELVRQALAAESGKQ